MTPQPSQWLAADMAGQEDIEGAPYSWSRAQYEEYVGSGGTERARADGKKVVILTTYDADTRKIRKSPLMRVKHGSEYAVIGSHGGDPDHPRWYRDVLVHPMVELQDGVLKAVYRAHEATGHEREIWWRRALEVWPDYAVDAQRAGRVIPVVVLTPEV